MERELYQKSTSELLRDWNEICDCLGMLACTDADVSHLELQAKMLVREMQFRGIDFE